MDGLAGHELIAHQIEIGRRHIRHCRDFARRQPFDHALKAVSSFYVVYPPEAIRQRKVKAFRDWLFAEVG